MRSLVLLALFAAATALALPARAQSMFADPKARRAGDLLTIVLAERTAASRESGWQSKSDAGLRADAAVSGAGTLAGRFAADATVNKNALNRNESVQSDLLSGTITAIVDSVDAATGLLYVRGERRLSVNGEAHLMKVSGLVRPYDVRYDNTVLSFQVANANIEYRRAGFHRRFFKPALLVRTGVVLALGVAGFALL